jgi:serine/threonine protein kinase
VKPELLERVGHHALGMLSSLYWARGWRALRAQLETSGFAELRPFRPWSWKHDSRYLFARRGAEPVFIKLLDDAELASREVAIHQHLLRLPQPREPWFAPLVASGSSLGQHWLAFHRLTGVPLSRLEHAALRAAPRERYLTGLAEAYARLGEAQLIHRDIRPANLLVPSDGGNLVLIDFAFAVGTGVRAHEFGELELTPRHRRRLRRLGYGYNPEPGCWDDAHSITRVMEYIDPGCQEAAAYRVLRAAIGQRVYRQRV